jgi:cell division transport system permease protein
VPPADAARVAQALRETTGVRRVERIRPDQAKQRLMHRLGSDADVVAEVEASYLPASFEVTLGGDRDTVKAAQRRLARMAGVVPGVEAVRTVETWFHQLERLIHGIRLAGLALALMVLAACVYIIMITIRLQFMDRQEELQVMRLMGATGRFIRTPYLLEGMGHGVLGALVATGLLYGLFRLVSARAGDLFGASVRGEQLGFLSPTHLACGLGIGLLCGLLGAALATRRRGAHV